VLRLFSMFPAGAPGVALLMLRVGLAAAILDGGPDCLKPAVAPLICAALVAQSLLLCIGFMTPIVSFIACLFELLSLLIVAHTDMRYALLSSLNAAAIALLGPGGYSVDAWLFGRRVIVFRTGREHNRS
jgi:uncharacterized membrane protein YphA (DoxX/SURF4 family)